MFLPVKFSDDHGSVPRVILVSTASDSERIMALDEFRATS